MQMNFFKSFKKNSAKWNCFSAADTLGSFDFMTLMVTLDSLEIHHYEKLGDLLQRFDYKDGLLNRRLNTDLYKSLSQVYGLAYHEYTHFIDCTCTVWGIEFLNILNAAYLTNHDLYRTEESEFYKAKKLVDLLKSIKLPNYYTSLECDVSDVKPWKQYLTIGRKFDSKGFVSDEPIPFISFLNSNNERIVRSPISLIALLEISATAQEFLYKIFLIHALSEDARIVEKHLVERDMLKFMYNPNLTEYTACAHLVANALGYSDILQSYTFCERISTLVLNLTEDHFDKIKLSALAIRQLELNTDRDFEKSMYDALKNRDRGFVFLLICLMIKKSKQSGDVELMLRKALSEFGLDYFQVIIEARRYVELAADKLKSSPYELLSKLSFSALKNFDQKVGAKNGMYDFSRFDLPPVMFGDAEIRNVCPGQENSLKDFDVSNSYIELIKGQQWVERFSEACG